jgi:hypothetical protein
MSRIGIAGPPWVLCYCVRGHRFLAIRRGRGRIEIAAIIGDCDGRPTPAATARARRCTRGRPLPSPLVDWMARSAQRRTGHRNARHTVRLSIISLELPIPLPVCHFGPVIVFEARRVLPRGPVNVEDKAIRSAIQAKRLPRNRVQRVPNS